MFIKSLYKCIGEYKFLNSMLIYIRYVLKRLKRSKNVPELNDLYHE